MEQKALFVLDIHTEHKNTLYLAERIFSVKPGGIYL
jgi:hypothetical protein